MRNVEEAAPATALPEPDAEPTLEERLSAAKAKRREMAEAAAAVEAEGALLAQVLNEERALRDEAAIAAAKRKHGPGKIAIVRNVGAKDFDVVILKRAHAAAFKAFQDKEGFKIDDVEELVAPCVEYPSAEAFSKFHTNDAPMVLARCGEAVAYLAGMRKTNDLGKV